MPNPLEGHTTQRYDGDLNNLHLTALEMGGLVQDQLRQTLIALKKQSPEIARTVVQREDQVDQLELLIDNEVAAVIARRGPVARDLRILISISKAVTDLEHIGDESCRIAQLVADMYDSDMAPPAKPLLRDVKLMGKQAEEILSDALECFDTLNVQRARTMLCHENELELEFQSSLRTLATYLMEDARNVGHTIHIVLLIKALERIGDHARDIAGYVVYMISGEDVRHRHKVWCDTDTEDGDGTGNN